MQASIGRRVAAEGLGSAFLLAAVVGSGIMGERLAGGNTALALLANSIATGAALVALIFSLAPISGAHLNPAVSLVAAWNGSLAWRDVPGYIVAQIAGAFVGVAAANVMFALPPFFASEHARSGAAQLLSEVVATFGLLSVIAGSGRAPASAPFAVGAYIAAAYWFTSSTSFANPAVTMARAATDTFSGIRHADVAPFVAAQLFGAAAAGGLWRWLDPVEERSRPVKVIFACVHSAGRSQMAAAFFNALADPTRALAASAGTDPAKCVHPEVIGAMLELGLDLRGAQPQRLTDELALSAHLLVTMGCGESCPVAPGVRRLDWTLPDPKGRPTDEVRRIRDEVRALVAELVATEGWSR